MASGWRWIPVMAAPLPVGCSSQLRFARDDEYEREREGAIGPQPNTWREERAEQRERVSGALERAQLFAARRLPRGETELKPARWFHAEQQMKSMRRHPPSADGNPLNAKGAAAVARLGLRMRRAARARSSSIRAILDDGRGGVSGGVWKSVDAGTSWQPLSDDGELNSVRCHRPGTSRYAACGHRRALSRQRHAVDA